MINIEQYENIHLSDEQSETYDEILELITKKGLSIKQAHELCIACAYDIYGMGIKQQFLGNPVI